MTNVGATPAPATAHAGTNQSVLKWWGLGSQSEPLPHNFVSTHAVSRAWLPPSWAQDFEPCSEQSLDWPRCSTERSSLGPKCRQRATHMELGTLAPCPIRSERAEIAERGRSVGGTVRSNLAKRGQVAIVARKRTGLSLRQQIVRVQTHTHTSTTALLPCRHVLVPVLTLSASPPPQTHSPLLRSWDKGAVLACVRAHGLASWRVNWVVPASLPHASPWRQKAAVRGRPGEAAPLAMAGL